MHFLLRREMKIREAPGRPSRAHGLTGPTAWKVRADF
jgi:hypothetical protein